MPVIRPYWLNLIEEAWKKKNIVWLMGVRRVGKTSLCLSIPDAEYFDCELPRVRQLMEDPEGFLKSQQGKRIILDEVRRLDNPSEILKICADHYPDVKIIATGSSTLGASAKFRDTLTGRKKEIWLTPLLLEEMSLFGNEDIRHRFLFGGFPSYFEQDELPEESFREWIDAYWAKDIYEMFAVGKRYSFQKCAELLLAYSGGQFEASKYAAPCETTRQTISNYLAVLEQTFVVHVIRPFSSHRATEIVLAPKVYGFDTGFVCFSKGWRELKKEDLGLLWEQCVLNEIHGKLQKNIVNYWRDKKGYEVDFVIPKRGSDEIIAIECKFSISEKKLGGSSAADIAKNFAAFRKIYPSGENLVVAYDIHQSFERTYGDIKISFINAHELIKRIQKKNS